MKKTNAELAEEIRKIREQLYECIEKNGIIDDPKLMDINTRLDELIVQWMKENS